MPIFIKVECVSSPAIEGADAMALTTCDHVLSDQRACLSDVDAVLVLLWAITPNGFPSRFGPFLLRCTSVVYWSSFSAVLWCQCGKSNTDWAWWAKSLSATFRLSTYQGRKMLWMLRSMSSTKNCAASDCYRSHRSRELVVITFGGSFTTLTRILWVFLLFLQPWPLLPRLHIISTGE